MRTQSKCTFPFNLRNSEIGAIIQTFFLSEFSMMFKNIHNFDLDFCTPPPSGSRSHWFEISCVWYDVLNFDLKSCTFKDQGHLCICWTFTLSLIAPTIKETYLICWMFVWWYVVPFGLAVWWQPTFMFCFEK